MPNRIKNELDWLKENAQFLSIKAIEKAIGCPSTTIQQFVGKAERPLPQKWQGKVLNWIQSFKGK